MPDGVTTTPPPLHSRDLWRVTDRLTRQSHIRLRRDDGHRERIQIPSLYEQLVEAIESGAGGAGHGKQASKPPLDTAALALLIEIAARVRTGCWNWKIRRTRDNAADLRSIVTAVIAHDDQDTIEQTHHQIKTWNARIAATISNDPDRTWRMHGAACRICGSRTVPAWDEDGAETRVPALVVHSDEGTIDLIECAFCGSKLTGEDLAVLVNDTLKNLARSKTA